MAPGMLKFLELGDGTAVENRHLFAAVELRLEGRGGYVRRAVDMFGELAKRDADHVGAGKYLEARVRPCVGAAGEDTDAGIAGTG